MVRPPASTRRRYWCLERGGRLAELYSDGQMAAVRRLLLRDGGGRDNWWLGLQQSSATWLTSGRPRNYSHWVEGEPSRHTCSLVT